MCLAVPGKLLSITGAAGEDAAFRGGTADFAGVRRDVSLAFTPEARVGDYVLVHAGLALTVIDEEEAQATLAELRRLGEAMEEFDARAAGGAAPTP
jgi:hydrogenase expression/formation protein HypC